MTFGLAYVQLTFAHFEDQDLAHFDQEYLINGERERANITVTIVYEVMYVLSTGSFTFDLRPFKVTHFDCEYLALAMLLLP